MLANPERVAWQLSSATGLSALHLRLVAQADVVMSVGIRLWDMLVFSTSDGAKLTGGPCVA
ncbi:hypothetical protein BN1263390073 [Stenotrophomonas maltophilia]|nr:hypothetical protein BN1263390073 [Stenotrophomonas maltophilia]